MLQAVLAAAALTFSPPGAASTEPKGEPVQACLYADLAREDWPTGVFVLHRRFPGGQRTRHLALFPAPKDQPLAPPQGPRVMLVYELGERAPKAPVQVSVSDVVIFGAGSPASATFEILVDGVRVDRTPWPEYAAAEQAFRRTGSPRYVAAELWPVWGEKGAPLRRRLTPNAKRLEARLIDDDGRRFRSSVYDLAAQPIPRGELGAVVTRFSASDRPWCFEEPKPD